MGCLLSTLQLAQENAMFDSVSSRWIAVFFGVLMISTVALAQRAKPKRAQPPNFQSAEMNEVFFENAASLLKGQLPKSQMSVTGIRPDQGDATVESTDSVGSSDDPLSWAKLISPTSLEDLVKGSKLRLEQVVTTPAAFMSGGFATARKEFSLQALLFAVVESYPNDSVRWKQSAALAREQLARAAANTKVGSGPAYNEAKQRLLDLGDLLNGTQLSGKAMSDVDWGNLIDRVPLMQLLEWAEQDYVSKFSASENEFASHKEELKRYAELVAILGKASIQPEMPDADDEDYQTLVKLLIQHAQQVSLAVETNNGSLAREAASRIGQCCQDCHDSYR